MFMGHEVDDVWSYLSRVNLLFEHNKSLISAFNIEPARLYYVTH